VVIFTCETPDAAVDLVSKSDGKKRRFPMFPIQVEFDTSLETYWIEATAPGFVPLKHLISFEDGEAKKEIHIRREKMSRKGE
jgi:hypothetical protein